MLLGTPWTGYSVASSKGEHDIADEIEMLTKNILVWEIPEGC